jgi:hypothetical protein
MGLRLFLFTYLLGGLTFIPLLLLAVIVPAWYLLPKEPSQEPSVFGEDEASPNSVKSLEKDSRVDGKSEGDKRSRSLTGETAASGTFAVLRQYDFQAAISALNAKNPNSSNGVPGGDGSAGAEPGTTTGSESVYQSMYRSVFNKASSTRELLQRGGDGNDDRDQSQLGQTGTPAKNIRRKPVPANVLYILLRHGHLMIYESAAQVEVKHVISLAHHTIGLQSGVGIEEEEDRRLVPEPDLFIKRTAIVLRPIELPNGSLQPQIPGHAAPKPFYLFSPSNIDKEDFYHALLATRPSPPIPRPLDTNALTKLQKALHSSSLTPETRAFSALLGRIFLALHRSDHITALIRSKIERKLDRIPKPSFIPSLSLQSLDLGDAAPTISAPRLRDFNAVSGEMTLALDLRYTEGTLALTLLAVATLDLGLGPRFKPRSVTLALKTSLQRVVGTLLLRIKPPPSNRIWFTFETMPDLGIRVEPVVSERKITYGFILRAIEERIRNAVGEGLVKPNWDDAPMPLTETLGSHARGGLWSSEGEDDDPLPHESKRITRKTSSGSTTAGLGQQNGRSASTPTLIPDLSEGAETDDFTTTSLSATASELNLSNPKDYDSLRRRPTTASIASTSSSSTLVDPAAPALPARRKPVRSPSLSAPPPPSSAPPVVALTAAGHHVNTSSATPVSSADNSTSDLRGVGPGGLGVAFSSSQYRHSRQSSVGSTNSGASSGNSLWRRAAGVAAAVTRNSPASQKDAMEELRHLAEREMLAAQAAELIAAQSDDESNEPGSTRPGGGERVSGAGVEDEADHDILATEDNRKGSVEDITVDSTTNNYPVRSPSLISKSSTLSSSSSTVQQLQSSSNYPTVPSSTSPMASPNIRNSSTDSNVNHGEPVLSGKRITSGEGANTTPNQNRKSTILSATATAATAARNWGWNALQKRNAAAAAASARSPRQQNTARQQRDKSPSAAASAAATLAAQPSEPYGRGQPLPPPGVPLPGPPREKNGRSGWIGGGPSPGRTMSARGKTPGSDQQQYHEQSTQPEDSNEPIERPKASKRNSLIPTLAVVPSSGLNDTESSSSLSGLRGKPSSDSLASNRGNDSPTLLQDLPASRIPTKIRSRPSTRSPSPAMEGMLSDPDVDDFGPWRMNSGSGPAGAGARGSVGGYLDSNSAKRRSIVAENSRATPPPMKVSAEKHDEHVDDDDDDDDDYGAFNHNHGDDDDDDHTHNSDKQHAFREDIFSLSHPPSQSNRRAADGTEAANTTTETTSSLPPPSNNSNNHGPSSSSSPPQTKIPPALPARRKRPVSGMMSPENSSIPIPSSSRQVSNSHPSPSSSVPASTDLADIHLGLVPSPSPPPQSSSTKTNHAARTGDIASPSATAIDPGPSTGLKIPPSAISAVEEEIGGSSDSASVIVGERGAGPPNGDRSGKNNIGEGTTAADGHGKGEERLIDL